MHEQTERELRQHIRAMEELMKVIRKEDKMIARLMGEQKPRLRQLRVMRRQLKVLNLRLRAQRDQEEAKEER